MLSKTSLYKRTISNYFLYIAVMLIVLPSVRAYLTTKLGSVCRPQCIAAFASSTSYTIANPTEVTEIVKKSRFIGKVSPFKTVQEALTIIKQLSEPKASHNCWALRSSSVPSYERCSDDGEPGGTAGRPILMALEAEGVVDAVVVVTRYFGGIKLGAGGLCRAYGLAAKLVIAAADRVAVVPTTTLKVTAAVSDLGSLYQAVNSLSSCTLSIDETATTLNNKEQKEVRKDNNSQDKNSKENNDNNGSNHVVRLSEDYSSDATSVILRIKIPAEFMDFFRKKITDLCRGSAEVEEEEEVGEDNLMGGELGEEEEGSELREINWDEKEDREEDE